MPKKINFSMLFDDNELFDEELTTVLREKIRGIVRSEFDALVVEECRKAIDSRLKSYYYTNPLNQAAKEVMENFVKGYDRHSKDNPIRQVVHDCFNANWKNSLEKYIKEETEKGIKAKLKKMQELV